MKIFLVTLSIFFLGTIPGIAAEITENDAGTFVLLDKDKIPTDLFYRLSKIDGKWVMEGKEPRGVWKNISCDNGCEYKTTTQSELETYFPTSWRENADIACIQNIAQAFCRFNPKNDLTKAGYVVIARVTSKPIPMFIKRIISTSYIEEKTSVKLSKDANYEKAFNWIKENNKWGVNAGVVIGFKKELDSAIGKSKAVWEIGWGITKSGNAYRIEWTKDDLVITPYLPDKAELLGYKALSEKCTIN